MSGSDDGGYGLDRHGLGHRHDHRFEQERKTALSTRPGKRLQLDNTALGAAYSRHSRGQIRLMLKKVEVSPSRLRGVISLHAFATAIRATEGASRQEIDADVQPFFFGIERRGRYIPWRFKAQG